MNNIESTLTVMAVPLLIIVGSILIFKCRNYLYYTNHSNNNPNLSLLIVNN
jgi:hypothetical protein